jgi:hypothetical protein
MRVNHSVAALLAEYRTTPAIKKTKKSKKRVATEEPEKLTVREVVVEEEEEDEEEDKIPQELDDGLDEDDDDPYRVRIERLTRVSHDEYNASSRCALPPSLSFSLAQLEQVSRRAYWEPQRPHDYYQHDPGSLVDALVLACHMESLARRTASQVPYEQLMVVENGDMTRIIERLCTDEEMRRQVQQTGEQYLFALMAVENATRHLPKHVRHALPKDCQDGTV